MAISVLMAVYKGDNPQFLSESLQSLKDQEEQAKETVVVKDGPITKEQDRIIDRFKEELNIITVELDSNMGLAVALNEGLKKCNGDFIARMDADDIALPSRFKIQREFLEIHQEIDVVGSSTQDIDAVGKLSTIVNYPKSNEACLARFKKRDPISHPTAMFRRRYFDKAGLYSAQYRKNQDTVLWMKGFQAGCRISNIPEVLLLFRVTEDFYKNRRGGVKKAWEIFKLRIRVSRQMKFGLASYFNAFFMLCLRLFPAKMLRFIYTFR